MFGIDLPINFASPYKARSIAEFWRRWHITLSRFLRDYLYITLGGNRRGPWRQRLNLLLTMALGGLWHGAEWTFLIWGCLHGLYLTINHLWRSWDWGRSLTSSRVGGSLSLALTLVCVVLAWVPFRAANLETAFRIWAGMFGAHGVVFPAGLVSAAWDLPTEPLLGFDAGSVVWLGVFLLIALKAPNVYQVLAPARLGLSSRGYPDASLPKVAPLLTWRPSLGVGVLVGVAMAVILLELNDVSEFIYFQF
jgi:hypothetical protein